MLCVQLCVTLCACSDTLIYAMSATAAGEEKAVEILSETVLRPKFSQQEVRQLFIRLPRCLLTTGFTLEVMLHTVCSGILN